MIKNIKKFVMLSVLYFVICGFYADASRVKLRSNQDMKHSQISRHHKGRGGQARFSRQDKENLR